MHRIIFIIIKSSLITLQCLTLTINKTANNECCVNHRFQSERIFEGCLRIQSWSLAEYEYFYCEVMRNINNPLDIDISRRLNDSCRRWLKFSEARRQYQDHNLARAAIFRSVRYDRNVSSVIYIYARMHAVDIHKDKHKADGRVNCKCLAVYRIGKNPQRLMIYCAIW